MIMVAKTVEPKRVMEFDNLPEGCIANVLSFTTPRDASALSLVSSSFRSAAQSDLVWERFLPSDYLSILSQSQFPNLSSKKDLFFHLCHKPLLVDSGKKSFALDKKYGKKCYMLSARSLSIVWGDSPRYWRWISLPDTRFSEVAELVSVCWLEIRGWINTAMLSEDTMYGAYLVYKPSLMGRSYGFDYQPVEVTVGVAGESDPPKRTVYLDAEKPQRQSQRQIIPRRSRHRYRLMAGVEEPAPPPPPPSPEPSVESVPNCKGGSECPKERDDGWWEIELGEFFNKGCEDREMEMAVYEVKSGDWKGGLVVQGIEIRSKFNPINSIASN
ncbi:hypothetical protein HN51_039806 [Arachis hypogaea]|uniref:F-box domain-containing protein n=1 Tax=Arachis hypogaea TaxID=3818 RepID=A0A444YL51_ARAHY|nr:putative F-box protein PP2-B12 [Arachis ipaensis]XP_025662840.1 putative F-box protein PP2-B12 [Arachis hypogaea]QHN85413.1 F-box protein [Arachis hypogaea]RYR02579.1 hypothetical protein Ahy_B06g081372 [Arachis hypogaea]